LKIHHALEAASHLTDWFSVTGSGGMAITIDNYFWTPALHCRNPVNSSVNRPRRPAKWHCFESSKGWSRARAEAARFNRKVSGTSAPTAN